MATEQKTISLDFDGVIHWFRRGWADGSLYDPPTPGCREALQSLAHDGYRLVVCTAEGRALGDVQRYLAQYDLSRYISSVTHTKPAAVFYIDDRAVKFANWEQTLRQLNA